MKLAEYVARKADLEQRLTNFQSTAAKLSQGRVELKAKAKELAAAKSVVLREIAVAERAITNLTNPERPPAQMLGARAKE